MNYKPRLGDEIYIRGHDEVFIVELVNTQMKYINFTYVNQTLYSIKSKSTGMRYEITDKDIQEKRTDIVVKTRIDELLDEYNHLMMLEDNFVGGGFKELAEKVMDKLHSSRY